MNFDHLQAVSDGKIDQVATLELRKIADYLRTWLPVIDAHLRTEDEKELAEARARVAEIEARLRGKSILLGAAATDTAQAIAGNRIKGKSDDWAETDAGMGIGSDVTNGVTADSFRSELAQLREQSMARRRRRGAA